MAKKLIVSNWKMNPDSLKEANGLFTAVKKAATKLKRVKAIICPPAVFLCPLATGYLPERRRSERAGRLQATSFTLGAQDCFHEKKGAHTGELSAAMLCKAGARYVLVGHSERREQGETNSHAARKISNAFDAGLVPILCIGEKVRDEHGFFLKYIEEQLSESLNGVSKKRIASVIVTYEPIWAISTNDLRPATPEECNEMVLYIRKLLAAKIGVGAAKAVPFLYGGSVDAKNCEVFLRHGGVQGLLVGHASLDAKQFTAILQLAEKLP